MDIKNILDKDKISIRLGGAGGQGLITAGIILAESFIKQGKNAIQSQSYGPEARGGASKAEVILSSEEIVFPKVLEADVFIALTQDAFNKYSNGVGEDSLTIIDENIDIGNFNKGKVVKLPILYSAREETGKEITANIVTLGAVAELFPSINNDILLETILTKIPKGTEEMNTIAFKAGCKLISDLGL